MQLAELTVSRLCPPGIWDDEHTWLKNAEEENTRHPFHAILAHDDPHNRSNVVRADDFLNMPTPAVWRTPRSIIVDRDCGFNGNLPHAHAALCNANPFH